MRQDRENKEQFLSQFLFCGLTPAYQQSSVRILQFKLGKQIHSDE